MHRKILIVAILLVSSQPSFAETEQEMQARLPVKHLTAAGTIMCRDPQIPFDEKTWLLDSSSRERMMVSVLIEKLWLHKDQEYMDKLFGGRKTKTQSGICYLFRTWSKCAQQPALTVEAEFDKDNKVARYRSVYYPEGIATPGVDSNWIE